jgi:hypothetical protein
MAKYGKKAQSKVGRALHEEKRGTLRSGGSGKKVTSRKQAIAIGLSEARKAGGKVPKKRASAGSKKKTAGSKKKTGGTKRKSSGRTSAVKKSAGGKRKTGSRKSKA